jgi:prephenate dehydratase
VFGLEVLQEAVQDYEYNITRFAIIGGAAGPTRTRRRSSSLCRVRPGALFKALSVFALRDINLTKLESRPIRGRPWEYLFYVEVGSASRRHGMLARADAPGRIRQVDARARHVQGLAAQGGKLAICDL